MLPEYGNIAEWIPFRATTALLGASSFSFRDALNLIVLICFAFGAILILLNLLALNRKKTINTDGYGYLTILFLFFVAETILDDFVLWSTPRTTLEFYVAVGRLFLFIVASIASFITWRCVFRRKND